MKKEIKKFTIDTICSHVEMKRRTVRYYIQKGLVDPPEGIGKGAFYSHTHLEQLLSIRKWKAAGLSLGRIQDILESEKGGYDTDKPVPPPLTRKQGTVEVWYRMDTPPARTGDDNTSGHGLLSAASASPAIWAASTGSLRPHTAR